ncbi:hypothetical protein LEFCBN_LEFCBN_16250, partial [Dysosmobacter welbionis]
KISDPDRADVLHSPVPAAGAVRRRRDGLGRRGHGQPGGGGPGDAVQPAGAVFAGWVHPGDEGGGPEAE